MVKSNVLTYSGDAVVRSVKVAQRGAAGQSMYAGHTVVRYIEVDEVRCFAKIENFKFVVLVENKTTDLFLSSD